MHTKDNADAYKGLYDFLNRMHAKDYADAYKGVHYYLNGK